MPKRKASGSGATTCFFLRFASRFSADVSGAFASPSHRAGLRSSSMLERLTQLLAATAHDTACGGFSELPDRFRQTPAASTSAAVTRVLGLLRD